MPLLGVDVDVPGVEAVVVGLGRRAVVDPKPTPGWRGFIVSVFALFGRLGCIGVNEFDDNIVFIGDACFCGILGFGVDHENFGVLLVIVLGGDFVLLMLDGDDVRETWLLEDDCHSKPSLTGAPPFLPNTRASNVSSPLPPGEDPPFIACMPGAPPKERNSPADWPPCAVEDNSRSFWICSASILLERDLIVAIKDLNCFMIRMIQLITLAV